MRERSDHRSSRPRRKSVAEVTEATLLRRGGALWRASVASPTSTRSDPQIFFYPRHPLSRHRSGYTFERSAAILSPTGSHELFVLRIGSIREQWREVSEPVERLFTILVAIPIGLDKTRRLRQSSALHRQGIFYGHIVGLSIQAPEEELARLHHFSIPLRIHLSTFDQLYTTHFAEKRTWRVCDDQIPFWYPSVFTIHRRELSASLQQRRDISLNVPTRISTSPTWFNIATIGHTALIPKRLTFDLGFLTCYQHIDLLILHNRHTSSFRTSHTWL